MPEYDVIVVGAGHAGCEAALAAARMGARTALITARKDRIASMPCNPSVGGIAKSHLVCELDALGGEIGRNADYTGIQFRVLNTRKGPAVRANRVQCDKHAYHQRMRGIVETTPRLNVIAGEVVDLLIEGDDCIGILLADGTAIQGKRTILCSGTSLSGTIHIGHQCHPGGGGGLPTATRLSQALRKRSLRMARLKTGTPPRLDANSINYGAMEMQPGLQPAPFFSWEVNRRFHVEHSRDPRNPFARHPKRFHVEHSEDWHPPWIPGSDQVSCYLTHTTEETHRIIRENLERSSLYGGHIVGTGVRYCPSVEDKIVKFPDRARHHVFIEPEGRGAAWIYPNGISNSLPREVQAAMVHSIPGLEAAVIAAWAYAIEYDYIDPRQLSRTLEVRQIPRLYIAGQVCGTTGYEEAAALGFVAGVNAVLALRGEAPLLFGREEAYIGVMIDDLITKGTDEPYRMFTSRAEHRLLLRQDNARFRMAGHAERLGIVPGEYIEETKTFARQVAETIAWLKVTRRAGVCLADLMRRPEASFESVVGSDLSLPPAVIEETVIELTYEGYIRRQHEAVVKQAAMEHLEIPYGYNYLCIKQLRTEARERLSRVRPETLGQAARIPGISPADIAVLSVLLEGRSKQEVAPCRSLS